MNAVTRRFLDYAIDMAGAAAVDAIMVYADVFGEDGSLQDFVKSAGDVRTVLVARGGEGVREAAGAEVINVPDVRLTRLGQIKVAVILGLSRGIFHRGDRLLCLTGMAMTGEIDGLVLMDVGTEFELFASGDAGDVGAGVNPEVIERVVDIAVALGSEGREGKPVGATFVLGDTDHVLENCEPLVLNPFQGYPPEQRNILDAEVAETVKEFSTIDGAFIIRSDGVVEAAGMFLRTEARNVQIPRGLGARHKSAAAITAITGATAVTVSESSGNVTIYKDGKIVVEIEKPRPIGGPQGRMAVSGPGRAALDYEPTP